MISGPSSDQLESVLRPAVERRGLDLEEVKCTPAGRRRLLRVVVDKDGGVTLDELADASRAVSNAVDHSEVMDEAPYTLEVTSPGTDRPLTLPRHWRRNVGRLVAVTLADGSGITGRVMSADEHGAVLDVSGTQRDVAYAGVAKAVVQVELTKPKQRFSAKGG